MRSDWPKLKKRRMALFGGAPSRYRPRCPLPFAVKTGSYPQKVPVFGIIATSHRTDVGKKYLEKAHGFFLLNGHNIVTEHGDIVIQNIGTVANRSGFLVTDTIRRYGFDVRFGYVRTDEMPTTTILDTGIKRNIHQQEGGNAKWQKT